jgi:hypothetical protein
VAGILVAVQLAAIYGTYYRAGYQAQGRYMFSVIGPFLALVWMGAVQWAPPRWARGPAALLLAAAVWLDARAWVEVIIPGFAR